jgi:hypothetical protein
MRNQRYYVTAEGGWWSFTRENFIQFLRDGVEAGCIPNSLDVLGRRLRSKPPRAHKLVTFDILGWRSEAYEVTLRELLAGKFFQMQTFGGRSRTRGHNY